ncbi:MAG: DUF5677 domain-containing protein [Syntrophales bacterium]|nr:DUF5677 domain-containing protein [Syntrophales bacterium]
MDIQSEYTKLITMFYKTVDSKRGTELSANDKWLFNAETLAVKLFYHLASILHLSFGTPLPQFDSRKLSFFDHASINVLARVAFETYLTFFFIYCDAGCTLEEHKFRHLIWKLSAPLDRKDFNLVSEAALQKLALDKQAMEKMLTELKNNEVFLALEERLRKKARKGEWRLNKSWVDLAELAGFDKQTFRSVYSYLCSYAHAGGLSGIQIGQAKTTKDQKDLSTISIHFGLLLISHFLFSYTSLFPETRLILDEDEQGYALVNKWHITWKEDGFKRRFVS